MAQSAAPITEDDAFIAAALEEAHLPSLIAAMVHLTGDASALDGDIKPVYDFFGDGQGGLSDAQRARVKKDALAAIAKYRDSGKSAAPLSEATIRRMMNFVAGAEIPDRYVPFLMEELALEGSDVKAAFTGQGVADAAKKNFHVLIVGAGMSGLLAAIRLKQAGISFTIIDKNKDVGGTWHVNTYPGCRVDNPNHLYSYSFEPNHDWPQHYSTQPVLNAYFQSVAQKYGIREKVRYETGLEEAVYDEARAIWKARLAHNGKTETIEVNAIITAVGQLNRPKYPDVKGRETFKGASFHSAEWNHSVDLKGKRVAVIGTGAIRVSVRARDRAGRERDVRVPAHSTLAGADAELSRQCRRGHEMASEAHPHLRQMVSLLAILDADRRHLRIRQGRSRMERRARIPSAR